MSVFSHPISISAERPLDPPTLAILELIDRLLRTAEIPYMLVGATARDLLLYHVYGHVVTRATYDVDFAVLVDSWTQLGVVKQLFLDTPGLTNKGRNTQRLYYQPSGVGFETIIDIIPFGKLENADRTIAWPPNADVVMNVGAFSDVFETSVIVAIRSDLLVPVPSLAGLIILKLFAWLGFGQYPLIEGCSRNICEKIFRRNRKCLGKFHDIFERGVLLQRDRAPACNVAKFIAPPSPM